MALKINYIFVLLRMLAASSLIAYNLLSVSAEEFIRENGISEDKYLGDINLYNITVPNVEDFLDSTINAADTGEQRIMDKMMFHSPTNPCMYYLDIPYEISEDSLQVGVDPPTKMLYIVFSAKQNVTADAFHWKKNIIVQKVSEVCDVNREVVESKEAAYAIKDGWLMAFFPYRGKFESTGMKFEYRSIVTSEGINMNAQFHQQLPVSSNYIRLSEVAWPNEE